MNENIIIQTAQLEEGCNSLQKIIDLTNENIELREQLDFAEKCSDVYFHQLEKLTKD